MTQKERIKDIMGYVRDLINDMKEGYEVFGYQAVIKYKDGTVKYINDIDGYEGVSLNCSKITYVLCDNPDDSIDSNGVSFIRDFCITSIPTEEEQEMWNQYVLSNL